MTEDGSGVMQCMVVGRDVQIEVAASDNIIKRWKWWKMEMEKEND